MSFEQFAIAIQNQTNCKIQIIGLEKETDHIWVRFQSESKETRQQAFLIVNTFVGDQCKIIDLPQLDNKSQSNAKSSSYSSSYGLDDFCYLNDESNNEPKCSGMVKSSTSIDFKASSLNESKPFGSVLSKFSLTSIKDNEYPVCVMDSQDENNNTHNNSLANGQTIKSASRSIVNNANTSYRYTVDFLLSRANVNDSKKMPENWRELNEKYPNVCFYGKVFFIRIFYYSSTAKLYF